MNTLHTIEQKESIDKAIYLEFVNIIPNINELLEVRKRYAIEYNKTSDEERAKLSLQGINYCNDNIKKLLGIPLSELAT